MGLGIEDAGLRQIVGALDGAASDALVNLTQRLYAGNISLTQWELGAASIIKDAHLANAAMGAGGNLGIAGYGRAGINLADEFRFLHNFAGEIKRGTISEAQALARIKQYGNAAKQAYWRELDQNTPEQALVDWRLNPGEHCPDCVSMAAGGPYKPGELTVYPGSGATQCRGSCNCELVRLGA